MGNDLEKLKAEIAALRSRKSGNYDAGYSQPIYKHVSEKKVVEPTLGTVDSNRTRRLENILDTGDVYQDGLNDYQRGGVDISQRAGDFMGELYRRLTV